MALTKVKFENFTAFEDLEVEFSPGINALIGANGTGKTHLMKACYAANSAEMFGPKLLKVFLPSGRSFDKLVHQAHRETVGHIEVHSGEQFLAFSIHSPGLASSDTTS